MEKARHRTKLCSREVHFCRFRYKAFGHPVPPWESPGRGDDIHVYDSGHADGRRLPHGGQYSTSGQQGRTTPHAAVWL